MTEYKITLLPGDGIGPEVLQQAVRVLQKVSDRTGIRFQTQEHLIGGCAIDAAGTALTEETLKACQNSDAVLLGAVGGPKWDNPDAKVRPEQGLLALRKGSVSSPTCARLKSIPPSSRLRPSNRKN
jgi:3-isopropylmalate dehydrogenase